ncbi:hypothetical protein [Nonomuraea zeae]|uniref:Uncharacterized protein n=1 Tax=Nonomuraea zeae TaxID=1642303 RepID=A0A5S4GGR4_9ACTN|nr:hypothetical protein [Nonomuraea zeae]TMR32167.1 hypothetical protein ETD85_23680 [Nonomuraea zeae]
MPSSPPPPAQPHSATAPDQQAPAERTRSRRRWGGRIVKGLAVAASVATITAFLTSFFGNVQPGPEPTTRFLTLLPGQETQMCTRLRGELSRPWEGVRPIVFHYNVQTKTFWFDEEVELDEQGLRLWSATASLGLADSKMKGAQYTIYVVDVPADQRGALRQSIGLQELPRGSRVLGQVSVVRSAVHTPCEKVPRLTPQG